MKDAIPELDAHGYGFVDFKSFLNFMAPRMKDADSVDKLKAQHGLISAAELRGVRSSLGEELTNEEVTDMINELTNEEVTGMIEELTNEEVTSIIKDVDLDRDGQVSLNNESITSALTWMDQNKDNNDLLHESISPRENPSSIWLTNPFVPRDDVLDTDLLTEMAFLIPISSP